MAQAILIHTVIGAEFVFIVWLYLWAKSNF